MKFFVLNSSGNVGKSTISRELLYSFMDNPKIIEIETVNSSSDKFNINVEKITDFNNFENLYLKIIETDNLILDVGASNLNQFCDKILEFAGIETLFDYFIVPTITGDKIGTDTARTILFLKNLGIPNEKIKVVFNNAKSINEFDILLQQEKALDYKFDTDLFIPNSSLFRELGLLRLTINEIFTENVEAYKNDILNAEPKEKMKLIKQDLANRMAVSIRPVLIDIYEAITNVKAINNLIFTDCENKKTSKTSKKTEIVSDEDGDL